MNKRFVPRLKRRLKISLGGRLPAFTADVSPGGFAVEAMQVMKVGSTVQGALTMEGREFAFTGKVTWAAYGEPRLSLRGRFGVRFTGIANEFFEVFQRAM
ncbi:MAG: PilZ domain-containing protein [Myxococcaceae bacterium]|nr:PilZ domain-containing protein [Myxococcaceae bacterium]